MTRALVSNNPIRKLLEKAGFQVHGISLIKQCPVAFDRVPRTPWVFFSSKNAVRFYCAENPQFSQQKVGAVGAGTALALKEYGVAADFIGEGIDTTKIGQTFSELVGDAQVLFPMAKASLRSIQKQFQDPKQVLDLVVYETMNDETLTLPKADKLVFTSPSNVHSYLKKQSIDSAAQVFAIGQSTAQTLREAGVKQVLLPWAPSELALADLLLSFS